MKLARYLLTVGADLAVAAISRPFPWPRWNFGSVRDWPPPKGAEALRFADHVAIVDEIEGFPSCEGLLEGIPTQGR